MHIRKKAFAIPELKACRFFVDRPDLLKGQWARHFTRQQPIHLELGCGKALATAQMALVNPDINYIAVDLSSDILGVARRNISQAFGEKAIDNILLVRWNIDTIEDIFSDEDTVERIYISFCNPWTKRAKQAKRRLTSPQKLVMYHQFLKDDGEIYLKTDNDELFEDSLVYFSHFGFEEVYLTRDLHASGFAPNFETEHEKMYVDQGKKISFVIVRKTQEEPDCDPKKWLLNYHRKPAVIDKENQ